VGECVRSRSEPHGLAVQGDPARTGLRDPEQDAGKLRASAADESGHANDLAAANGQAHILELTFPGESRDLEDNVTDRCVALRIQLCERATDHHPHDLVLTDVPHVPRGNEDSVAQDGDPVAHARNLLEAMPDEHHRHAVHPQLADHSEQALDLADRKRGRGLVEDDDLRLSRERTGNLHELLLRGPERARKQPWIGSETEHRKPTRRLTPHSPVIE
jgi:hypothetical protein